MNNETTTLIALMPGKRMLVMQAHDIEMTTDDRGIDVSAVGDSYARHVPGFRRSSIRAHLVGESQFHEQAGYQAVINWAMQRMMQEAIDTAMSAATEARKKIDEQLGRHGVEKIDEMNVAATAAIKRIVRAGERGRKFISKEAFSVSGRKVKVKKAAPAKRKAPARRGKK